jgi:hypothetical protein
MGYRNVFTETVVPAHELDVIFDLVLNTADHQTLDKSALWGEVIVAFCPEHSFSSVILIDDSPQMISLFESLGGFAYRYEGDEAFRVWLEESGFSEPN